MEQFTMFEDDNELHLTAQRVQESKFRPAPQPALIHPEPPKFKRKIQLEIGYTYTKEGVKWTVVRFPRLAGFNPSWLQVQDEAGNRMALTWQQFEEIINNEENGFSRLVQGRPADEEGNDA